MAKSSVARRADLKAAIKRFRKNETITLEDLARLWGVSKARFINIRSDIDDFPEHIGKQGNAILYNAKAALESLVRHETRNDQAVSVRSAKVARILGSNSGQAEEDALPPSEMLALAKVRAETDKRLREQGLLVLFTDVQQIASEVFGEISSTLSKLSDLVDPNGKLPAHVRDLVDGGGKEVLLRIYNRLNDMLGGNADLDVNPAAADRKRPDRARRTPVRKKRPRRVQPRARGNPSR